MRFAHLKGAERPLAVVEENRIAALAMDGIASIDELIAAGPARGTPRAMLPAPHSKAAGSTLQAGHARRTAQGAVRRSRAWASTTTTTAARPGWPPPSAR